MESRWTRIGNLPQVSYILKNGGNQLDISYIDVENVRSSLWVSITNPSEALIKLCTTNGCGDVLNDANNPGHKILILNDYGRKNPDSINYFIDAINAYYPLDDEMKQSIAIWVKKLAEKNKRIPMSVYDLPGTAALFKPAPARSQAWSDLGFQLSMMNYGHNAWK